MHYYDVKVTGELPWLWQHLAEDLVEAGTGLVTGDERDWEMR